MDSSLTHACQLRLQNFEGPFDLLFHLIEKNQVNLYDIPIHEITDQYMEYMFAMQQLDLEIASEFLVMAATLLHIKSKMLLPEPVVKTEEKETDPREELVRKLVEYRMFKEFASTLRQREADWENIHYKLPETLSFEREEVILELSPDQLVKVYEDLLRRMREKQNPNTAQKIEKILEHEKVSLKTKMKEIVRFLASRTFFRFSEMFSIRKKTRLEVVTGFLAILELTKLKRARLVQKTVFSDILVLRTKENPDTKDESGNSPSRDNREVDIIGPETN